MAKSVTTLTSAAENTGGPCSDLMLCCMTVDFSHAYLLTASKQYESAVRLLGVEASTRRRCPSPSAPCSRAAAAQLKRKWTVFLRKIRYPWLEVKVINICRRGHGQRERGGSAVAHRSVRIAERASTRGSPSSNVLATH